MTNYITKNLRYLLLPIIYIAIGLIVYNIIKRIINKSIKIESLRPQHRQRAQTVSMLLLNIIKYIILIIVLLAILSGFGINIKSILATLGITTAIIGLALQDLAKDIIAGFSIITENQYEVGDTIEVDAFMGEVISLGLKTTKIKDYKGAIKIISNHNMDKIINYSQSNSLAVIDIDVDYKHNPDDVEKVLKDLSIKLKNRVPNSLGDLTVQGITDLSTSSVVYRVTQKVKPMKQYEAERFLRKEIKKHFDENNIKMPYSQIEVHNAE